ncbi:MAG: response regulator [Roseiflexaceae bacterium]
MNILLVEDDYGVRDALTMLLEDEGYVVATAINGKEALDLLATHTPLPDVILLDLAMPIMDGWAFRAAQQQDERLAHIPVIVLSADRSVAKKAADITADAYLGKPVPIEELISILERFDPSLSR